MPDFKPEERVCQNCKSLFEIEAQDFGFYEKMKVPAPTWCPECRTWRRVMWRNEKTLYKRRCDATGKEVFSFIHPDSPLKVYERDYWWGDSWDPMEYGKDFDESRPFLGQLRELMQEVPWFSRSVLNLTNSDYCMNCSYLKDCYLTFHASHNEHCYYTVGINNSKDCFDNLFIDKSELCYECFDSANCYRCFYCDGCNDSQNLFLCKDCNNCQDCFGCVGLRNKKYCIFNEPFSKEEYEKKIKRMEPYSYDNLQKYKSQLEDLIKKVPSKYSHEIHNKDISGDYIYNSKNVKRSYIVNGGEDLKYCQNIILSPSAKDCYDYSFFGNGAELIYEASSVGIGVADIKFSAFLYPATERAAYSVMCPSSKDIFGCVGLKKKQYCILNKQYTKEEYEEMVKKIQKHMDDNPYADSKGRVYKYGEFFPPEFCPFGYNATTAQEYYPLTKKKAGEIGVPWVDPETKPYQVTVSWKDLPDVIEGVEDSILKEVVLCQSWDEEGEIRALEHNCSKAFKITPDELAFYRQMNLPLPRRCFNSRHYERTKLRNPIKLFDRKCQCAGKASDNNLYQNVVSHDHHGENHCPNEFETSYSPEKKEIVYCESCYNSEIA